MSRLIKCDKCGAILDDFESFNDGFCDPPAVLNLRPKYSEGRNVVNLPDMAPNVAGKDPLRFEFCQKCTDDLMKWVKGV